MDLYFAVVFVYLIYMVEDEQTYVSTVWQSWKRENLHVAYSETNGYIDPKKMDCAALD